MVVRRHSSGPGRSTGPGPRGHSTPHGAAPPAGDRSPRGGASSRLGCRAGSGYPAGTGGRAGPAAPAPGGSGPGRSSGREGHEQPWMPGHGVGHALATLEAGGQADRVVAVASLGDQLRPPRIAVATRSTTSPRTPGRSSRRVSARSQSPPGWSGLMAQRWLPRPTQVGSTCSADAPPPPRAGSGCRAATGPVTPATTHSQLQASTSCSDGQPVPGSR
jgi:hypothetical protein